LDRRLAGDHTRRQRNPNEPQRYSAAD